MERKTPLIIISWITILILSLIAFLIIGNISYNKYLSYTGVLTRGEDYYDIQFIVPHTILDIAKTYTLEINKKEYEIKELKVNDHLVENNNIYYSVIIRFNSDEDLKNNDIIKINFKSPKTTIINEIKNKLRR